MKNFIIRTINNEMTGNDAAIVVVAITIIVISAGFLLHAIGIKLAV